jgi:hypothetical protein
MFYNMENKQLCIASLKYREGLLSLSGKTPVEINQFRLKLAKIKLENLKEKIKKNKSIGETELQDCLFDVEQCEKLLFSNEYEVLQWKN